MRSLGLNRPRSSRGPEPAPASVPLLSTMSPPGARRQQKIAHGPGPGAYLGGKLHPTRRRDRAGPSLPGLRPASGQDPLNEDAHRQLMLTYARTGRTSQALRQFLECRRALVVELGVEPSEETSRLQARILAGESV